MDWNCSTKKVRFYRTLSLSSRRAWIEILNLVTYIINTSCRSPHGERGLKYHQVHRTYEALRRSPHGERGLKCKTHFPVARNAFVALLTESVDWNRPNVVNTKSAYSRSPHGERGLKCDGEPLGGGTTALLSSRRAWIEIKTVAAWCENERRRSPHGERGLKFCHWGKSYSMACGSLSSRRAWIEIAVTIYHSNIIPSRSPHGERGLKFDLIIARIFVLSVALLTESVDWNLVFCWYFDSFSWSLSSRRAWIEIAVQARRKQLYVVALLTESVDWNNFGQTFY